MDKEYIVANLQKLEDNIKNVSEFNRNFVCKIYNDNGTTFCILYSKYNNETLILLNTIKFKNYIDDEFLNLLYSKINLNKKKKETYISSLNSLKFDYVNLYLFYKKLTYLMTSKFDDKDKFSIINFDIIINPIGISKSLLTYLLNFYKVKYSNYFNENEIEDMVMNGVLRAYTRVHTYNPLKLPDEVNIDVPYLRLSKDKNMLKFFSWVLTVVENSFKSEIDHGYKTNKFNGIPLEFENDEGEVAQDYSVFSLSFENFNNLFNTLSNKIDNKEILEKIERLKYTNILPNKLRILFKGIYNAIYLTGTEAKEKPTKAYNDIKYTIMKENNWSDDEYRRNFFHLEKKLIQLGYI